MLTRIYRYIALQNDESGVGPLASYFKGEILHGRDTDIFTSNMCMCFLTSPDLIKLICPQILPKM
jgi:hypothetical protein